MANNKRDTKLTIADLIAKKTEKLNKQNKTQEYHVESLDGTITIEAPNKKIIYQAVDMRSDKFEDIMSANIFVVYNSVKFFQDKSLQEAWEVVEPTDVVEKILDIWEINEIATIAMDISGFKKPGQIEDDVKN